MRRGTLALFGPAPPPLLPSFRFSATCQPATISVMLKLLRSKHFSMDDSLLSSRFDLYRGDLVSLGRGEILFRHGLQV